ncbi:MAG: T9SS type A sorting domain-containing protein, partial [Bacteroidales bacterium]|nr:T9SS type A sorting domain-containing protein [Bacteroidales bacterium]
KYVSGNTASVSSSLAGSNIAFGLSAKINGEDVDYYLVTYNKFLSVNEGTPASKGFKLFENYPNPFNSITTIKYKIPEQDFVTLTVFDALGKEVATLVSEEKPAGTDEVEFSGSGLDSGIYYYKLQTGNFIETKKMNLLR